MEKYTEPKSDRPLPFVTLCLVSPGPGTPPCLPPLQAGVYPSGAAQITSTSTERPTKSSPSGANTCQGRSERDSSDHDLVSSSTVSASDERNAERKMFTGTLEISRNISTAPVSFRLSRSCRPHPILNCLSPSPPLLYFLFKFLKLIEKSETARSFCKDEGVRELVLASFVQYLHI